MRANDSPHVIVVGGGPAGLTAAIALASGGAPTLLIGDPPSARDNRTTALLAGSVAALEALHVWAWCDANAAPLRTMRIVDDTGRLLRAPEVKFDASEIALDAFGYNIENRYLVEALTRQAGQLASLAIRRERVEDITIEAKGASIVLTGGERIAARLIVGADGRSSLCRKAAGIPVDIRNYPQTALTVTFAHSRPHHDTSTEFHTPSGPFTVVPLPGARSSLVWVMTPADAEAMNRLSDNDLSLEVERRSHSILGKIKLEPGRGIFPLNSMQAHRMAAQRIALVGEAAHVIPPIGAQGLNLGLRDAAAIGEVVVDAIRRGNDPGTTEVLEAYDRARRVDVDSRTLAVDWLNRSLLTDFLPAQATRGVGLYLLDRIAPLRRAVMREGVTPASRQPRLMRGKAL
jgi:2-octaprenyl-6-methoxyphenol hydroxylase